MISMMSHDADSPPNWPSFGKATRPSFERPPVIEVVLSAQFAPLSELRVPHLGLLWNDYKSEFPEFDCRVQIELLSAGSVRDIKDDGLRAAADRGEIDTLYLERVRTASEAARVQVNRCPVGRVGQLEAVAAVGSDHVVGLSRHEVRQILILDLLKRLQRIRAEVRVKLDDRLIEVGRRLAAIGRDESISAVGEGSGRRQRDRAGICAA